MYPQASVEFAGIQQVLSFRGTWNHGIEPSVFVLEIVPQPVNTIALYGSMRFRYGDEVWEIPNCLVDSGSYSLNASGEVVSLLIKDYRWKWEYASTSGTYNVRDERGDIIDAGEDVAPDDLLRRTKRDTVWLINKLLDSMEVFTRSIEATIPEYYPECLWDDDNAARALQDILSKLALRLAPQLDGSVKIVNAGIGQRLPQDAIETFGNDINPAELPRRIRVVSGPIYYTVDFMLYPSRVSPLDFAKPLPIDDFSIAAIGDLRQLSPLSGFVDPEDTKPVRKASEISAFKWFRVVNGSVRIGYTGVGEKTKVPYTSGFFGLNKIILPDNGIGEPFQIEFGFGEADIGFYGDHNIIFLSQFELQDFCCERTQSTDVANGAVKESLPFKRPFVWGAFYHESDGAESEELWANKNSVDKIFLILGDQLSYLRDDDYTNNLNRYICPVPFELDKELGLVKFSSPVYLMKAIDAGESESSIQWPELALRCAIRVKNKATGNWIRRERVRELDPASPAKEIVYRLDDLNVYYEIDGTSNVDAVNRTMDDFINAIHANLMRKIQSATATYAKWFKFELDGAIQSITWAMSESGARMTISRNIDTGSDTALDYELRIRKTQFKKNAEWVAKRDLLLKREEFGL